MIARAFSMQGGILLLCVFADVRVSVSVWCFGAESEAASTSQCKA